MPNKASISNDLTTQFYPPCMSIHEYFGPTPPGVPPPLSVKPGIAAEIPVPMFWPPGFGLGQNKLTTTVVHKNLAIVQDGHDCGTLIIHVQVVPYIANVLTALHIPFSSRKTNFFSSTVLPQGKCLAAATLISWPPAPMTTCWDPVSPPLSSAPTAHLNTLVFTMSWADIIIGWVSVAASMVLEFLLDKHAPPSPVPEKYWLAFGEGLLSKLVPTSPHAWRGWLAKAGLGGLTGAARMAFTDGPADIKVAVGSPFLQGELGFGRDDKGQWSAAAGARSLNRSGEAKVGSKGVTTKTEQAGRDSVDTQETTPDGQTTSTTSPTHRRTLSDWGSNWGSPL